MEVKLILVAITLILIIITSIAAIIDLKKGIIPNKLTLFLGTFGLIVNGSISLFENNITYILNSIMVGVLTFGISYLLWKFRFWGGGDVKLLTAIALTLPTNPLIVNWSIIGKNLPEIAIYPFPLTIIFNSILVSFPFLITYVLFNSFEFSFKEVNFSNRIFNRKNKQKTNNKHNNNNNNNSNNNNNKNKNKNKNNKINKNLINNLIRILIKKIAISFIIAIILTFFFDILILIKDFLIKGFSSDFSIFSLCSSINFINNVELLFFNFIIILISNIIFTLVFAFISKYIISDFKFNFKNLRKIAKLSFNKYIAISELKEGMILDEVKLNDLYEENIKKDIKKDSKRYGKYKNYKKYEKCREYANLEYSEEYLGEVYENIIYSDLFDEDSCVIKSKTAAGLSYRDISLIKQINNAGLIKDNVPIKMGIPFGPSIAIGFLIAIFFGDLALLFFNFL